MSARPSVISVVSKIKMRSILLSFRQSRTLSLPKRKKKPSGDEESTLYYKVYFSSAWRKVIACLIPSTHTSVEMTKAVIFATSGINRVAPPHSRKAVLPTLFKKRKAEEQAKTEVIYGRSSKMPVLAKPE